ncbi:MAG: hypothetical protein WBN03_10985 [Desulfobacterales bacterium]
MPPRNAADFLELAENCTFLERKLSQDFYEIWNWNSASFCPEIHNFALPFCHLVCLDADAGAEAFPVPGQTAFFTARN